MAVSIPIDPEDSISVIPTAAKKTILNEFNPTDFLKTDALVMYSSVIQPIYFSVIPVETFPLRPQCLAAVTYYHQQEIQSF
jgi:hypothetical protein